MNFFVLSSPKHIGAAGLTEFFARDPETTGEAPRCKVCGGFIGSIPWLPPCFAELEVWGREPRDIAFGPGMERLISGRLRDLYSSAELSGFSGFHPVTIQRVKRRSCQKNLVIPSYYCVYVAHSRAVVDEKASGLVRDRPWTCEECHIGGIMRTQRVCLVPGTWSSEDVFVARGLPGTVIVSERFAELLRRNRMGDDILVPADKYSFDFYPGKEGVTA